MTLCLRIMLSFVWCSVQLWWGGAVVKTFIGALWPSFYNVDYPLAGGTMEASDFIGFIIFAVICVPVVWVPPERCRSILRVRAVLTPDHKFFMTASVAIIVCVFAMRE